MVILEISLRAFSYQNLKWIQYIQRKISNETKQDDMSSTNKVTSFLPREDSLQELWRELEIRDCDRDEQGNEPPTREKSCRLESK